MAGSKKDIKNPHADIIPDKPIRIGGDPERLWGQPPSWKFFRADTIEGGRWAFNKVRLYDEFWDKIFPKLRDFETRSLNDIFVRTKKQNHGISVSDLNKDAKDRLNELKINTEVVYSLRLDGTSRLYGLLEGASFIILWYDDNHGDNSTCVCRSKKKHT